MRERVYNAVHPRVFALCLGRFLVHSPATLAGALDLVMIGTQAAEVRVRFATQRVDVIYVCGPLGTTSSG